MGLWECTYLYSLQQLSLQMAAAAYGLVSQFGFQMAAMLYRYVSVRRPVWLEKLLSAWWYRPALVVGICLAATAYATLFYLSFSGRAVLTELIDIWL